MAPRLRYVGKKRGNRTTTSPSVGSAADALFYAVFLLIGCVGLGAMIYFLLIPEWRVNHEFVAHQCRVVDQRIAEKDGDDGKLYRPEIKIEYDVDGVKHIQWTYDSATVWNLTSSYTSDRAAAEAVLEEFAENRVYPCRYDPLDPNTVVLVHGTTWWIWMIAIVPLSFALIGGGGLIYRMLRWGKSAEHRAAMSQTMIDRDRPFGDRAEPVFPNIPPGNDITNSPGTKLAYRLPIGMSPGWKLFGIAFGCLFWNGIVSVFVTIAVTSHLDGDPEWFLTLFIIPFVLIGLLLIYLFLRQLLVTTGIGPTTVEVSDHPLVPGGEYRLLVSQSGRLQMNSLIVSLICHEMATYQQGTDTRTESREVCREEIYRREGFEVHRGFPYEAEIDVTIPEDAMHSFKADHNEIQWNIRVVGDVAGWPDYERSFPVIIRPVPTRSQTPDSEESAYSR